jgi:hypothetical protein
LAYPEVGETSQPAMVSLSVTRNRPFVLVIVCPRLLKLAANFWLSGGLSSEGN